MSTIVDFDIYYNWYCTKKRETLTLIWVGFLGVRFEVGGEVKLPPV